MGDDVVTVRPDRRLALLAVAKFASIGACIGAFLGILMTVEGEGLWWLLLGPLVMAVFGGTTLGLVVALSWWAFPGHVTYAVGDGYLMAIRGRWLRQRIAVERISEIEFTEDIDGLGLALTGWFDYTSPIPVLVVTMTTTVDRCDVTNAATEFLPAILLSGERQRNALRDLRHAIGLPNT